MSARPGAATDAGTTTECRQRFDATTSAMAERDLIEAVRDGDVDAYGEIYRRHSDAVERLARRLCRDRHEADDVAGDVFCNTLNAIRSGSGPSDECRSYLLRSVRHTIVNRRTRKDTGRATPCPTDDLERQQLDDVPLAGGPATDALRDVSDRFQELLWYVEIQGHDSNDLAVREEIANPAASSMMYRARRSLRRAYLRGCVHAPISDDACTPIRSLMPAFVDGDVRTAGAERVRRHLAECVACNAALAEMQTVHDRIGTRGFFALLPGVIRVVMIDASSAIVAAVPGTSVIVAAATITLGAVALPSSNGHDPTTAADRVSTHVPQATGEPATVVDLHVPAVVGPEPTPSNVPVVEQPGVGATPQRPAAPIPTLDPVAAVPEVAIPTSTPAPVGPPVVPAVVAGVPAVVGDRILRDTIGGSVGSVGDAVGGVVDGVVGVVDGTATTVTSVVGVVTDVVSGAGDVIDGVAAPIIGGGGLVGPVLDASSIIDATGGLVGGLGSDLLQPFGSGRP